MAEVARWLGKYASSDQIPFSTIDNPFLKKAFDAYLLLAKVPRPPPTRRQLVGPIVINEVVSIWRALQPKRDK